MSPDGQNIKHHLDSLEERISDVISWGRIIRMIGTSRETPNRCDLQVLGDALDTLGARMSADIEAIILARSA